MNRTLNYTILIILFLTAIWVTYVMVKENDEVIIEKYVRKTSLMELPTYQEVTNYKYFNLVGHTFIHSDNCACKIF